MTVWGGARNPDLPRSSTAQQYCQAAVITNYPTQTGCRNSHWRSDFLALLIFNLGNGGAKNGEIKKIVEIPIVAKLSKYIFWAENQYKVY